jgi:Transmembrane secretion effector
MRPVHSSEVDAIREHSRARLNMSPIVAGQSVSLLGDYIAFVTVPFFVLELTGRAIDLGLTAAAETLPLLFFGFAAGVLLDRYRIKRILILADIARAGVFAALAFGSSGDSFQVWAVFGAAFVVGTMTTFFDSGLQSLLPAVVGQSMLVDANSRLSLARTIAFSVGPALGGLLVASSGGFPLAFGVNAATFLVSAALLVRIRELHARPEPAEETFLSALRNGLRFLIRDRHLRWGTMGAAFINFVFAPLEALLILFVSDRLAGMVDVPSWLDWLFAEQAEVGLFIALQAAIGSLGVAFAPRLAKRIPLGRMYIVGMILMGGGFVIVSRLTTFWAVFPAAIALTGIGWINVSFSTLRQRLTPAPMLGRVTAASRTIAYLFIPLGAAIGGWLADEIGLTTVYLAGSSAVLGLAILFMATPLWLWRSPAENEGGGSMMEQRLAVATKGLRRP